MYFYFLEKKRYRECFLYSRGMTCEFPGISNLNICGSGYKQEQRVSVISNASSNTTSGIVSDRVHSLDGSEGTFFLLFCLQIAREPKY